MGDETRELTDQEREDEDTLQGLFGYLERLRPQKRKQAIAKLFESLPDEFAEDLHRAIQLRGTEAIVPYIKELRRKAADPSLSKQERNDAAWELKDLGYDDESLRKDDLPDDAD